MGAMGPAQPRVARAPYAALWLLMAASLLLRSGRLAVGYWIDEGISVGIASHGAAQIPGVLGQDGSPPLYYLLLHEWIQIAGTGEAATRSLSLLFALAAVPAAWGAGAAVFDRRAGGRGGGRRGVRPPGRRPRRGGGGRLPVPDVLRAGDADVLAGGGAVAARLGGVRAGVRARAALAARAAGRLRDPAAVHPQLGAVPGRRDGRGLAAAVARRARRGARRPAGRRGRGRRVRAVAAHAGLPGAPHGGAVVAAADAAGAARRARRAVLAGGGAAAGHGGTPRGRPPADGRRRSRAAHRGRRGGRL